MSTRTNQGVALRLSKPPIRTDEDVLSPTYFDKPEFREYADLVGNIIETAKTALTIGDIKRRLGSRLNDDWLGCALEYWLTDRIEKVSEISPVRYQSKANNRRARLSTSDEINHGLFARKWKHPKSFANYADWQT